MSVTKRELAQNLNHDDRDPDPDGEDDAFISFSTAESKCEEAYERGVELKSCGQLESALSIFLECLGMMQECQYFAKLAQTLHHLAEIYHSLEQYDKAVEFAQAEKLFYEAVILDLHKSKEGNAKMKPKKKTVAVPDPTDSYGDLLIGKADEFDRLAHLCADEKKFQLALDYCGKAVKIRQSVFGSEHPVTVGSLEYFTILYAEVGRCQYATALQTIATPVPVDMKPANEDFTPAGKGEYSLESLGLESEHNIQEEEEPPKAPVTVAKPHSLWFLLVAMLVQLLIFAIASFITMW